MMSGFSFPDNSAPGLGIELPGDPHADNRHFSRSANQLTFHAPFDLENKSKAFRLTNPSHAHAAIYKIKTTDRDLVAASPKAGVLPPGGNVSVTVTLARFRYRPHDRNREKLLIQSAALQSAPIEISSREFNVMWREVVPSEVKDTAIRICFTDNTLVAESDPPPRAERASYPSRRGDVRLSDTEFKPPSRRTKNTPPSSLMTSRVATHAVTSSEEEEEFVRHGSSLPRQIAAPIAAPRSHRKRWMEQEGQQHGREKTYEEPEFYDERGRGDGMEAAPAADKPTLSRSLPTRKTQQQPIPKKMVDSYTEMELSDIPMERPVEAKTKKEGEDGNKKQVRFQEDAKDPLRELKLMLLKELEKEEQQRRAAADSSSCQATALKACAVVAVLSLSAALVRYVLKQ